MKSNLILLILVLLLLETFSQENKKFTNSLTIQSYLDLTKSGTVAASWATYDYKKMSFEARYNYDWDKNISLYAGLFLKANNWKFRLHQGLTFGSATGFSISPTTILDNDKIFVFNQTQYVIGFSKMPSYFSHWGEFYLKPTDFFWIGVSDRIYLDNSFKDIAFGPQVLFSFKNIYITLYWWIPTKQTESKGFLLMGYEHDFEKKTK